MTQLYFTGKPCKRGHVAHRFVSSRNCVECNKAAQRVANITPSQRARRKELFKPSPNARQNWQAWYYRNQKLASARTRAQQAARMKRVPAWSEKEEIEQFYLNCPDGMEVDHVIPLQGKTVSGLHVLANLQYLSVPANRSKGNKF